MNRGGLKGGCYKVNLRTHSTHEKTCFNGSTHPTHSLNSKELERVGEFFAHLPFTRICNLLYKLHKSQTFWFSLRFQIYCVFQFSSIEVLYSVDGYIWFNVNFHSCLFQSLWKIVGDCVSSVSFSWSGKTPFVFVLNIKSMEMGAFSFPIKSFVSKSESQDR